MKSTAQPDLDPQAPLPTGPTGLPKQRPALAQLREALTALHIGGLCRTVAYELLTYWSPGGDVFPSVKTLADDMGLKPRVVRHHIARLERVGLWVRIGRKGQTNLYALHLPGEAQEGFVQPRPRHTRAAPPGTHVPPKCSWKVLRAPSGRSAAYSKNGVVCKPDPVEAVTTAAPKKGSPVPSPGPLFVVATPDQAQPHIDAMLAFIAQRAAAAKASSPDPSTPSTFKLDPDIEARFEAQDRLYHEGEEQPSPQPAIPKKGVALSLDTLPPYLGGVPGVDQCGYDDGKGFTPSADQNQGL